MPSETESCYHYLNHRSPRQHDRRDDSVAKFAILNVQTNKMTWTTHGQPHI